MVLEPPLPPFVDTSAFCRRWNPFFSDKSKGRGRGHVATAEVRQEDLQRYKDVMDNRFGMMEEQLHAIMQQLVNLGARRTPTNPREENSNGSDVDPLH